MENEVVSAFEHVTHQLSRIDADHEVWCGGTQPPSLVSVDRSNSSMHIDIFPSDTDVHSKDLDVTPEASRDVEVKEGLTWAYNFDAYTISVGATRFVREYVGLNPTYFSKYATARQLREEAAYPQG